ncbi:MAG: hypothetical protein KL787_07705 [Taibaiella sp.]|nr:hypothetical protein [Taibaiella sp.]
MIKSRDVLHDIGLPHFRMKMDAVPGIITTMWFTPLYTTKRNAGEKPVNPDFVYEINCAEMCGKGHFSMRGTVVVSTEAEFEAWIKEQPSYYSTIQPAGEQKPVEGAAPKAEETNPADSAKTGTTVAVKN